MADSEIDLSDCPEISPEMFARAVVHRGLRSPPTKTQISLRIDSDVVAWFRARGRGYRPRYVARVEIDAYTWLPDERDLLGRPDVTVLEGGQDHGGIAEAVAAYGEPPMVTVHPPVRDTMRLGSIQLCTVSDQRVITVLEILSPANKRTGPGRRAYLRKRRAILDSPTHLVEIDLLRAGPPMPLGGAGRDVDYRSW